MSAKINKEKKTKENSVVKSLISKYKEQNTITIKSDKKIKAI